MPPRVNAKAQAGRERKAEQKALKDAEKAKQKEAAVAKEWEKGSNARGKARADEAAAKADEAARKRREKEALLKAEEEEMGSGKGKAKKTPTLSKKKGGKKKNDLSLLEDALVSAADKKQKAKKRAEREKKENEEADARKAAQIKAQEEKNKDPLLANTEAMIGSVDEANNNNIGRNANVAMGVDGIDASGIDAAIGSLSVAGGAQQDAHPEKRMKQLHREYEERMLPVVKEEYPGLRLTQYKEKIFNMWKKAPENPMNQQQQ